MPRAANRAPVPGAASSSASSVSRSKTMARDPVLRMSEPRCRMVDAMPCLASSNAVVRPTGPAPTIRTGDVGLLIAALEQAARKVLGDAHHGTARHDDVVA